MSRSFLKLAAPGLVLGALLGFPRSTRGVGDKTPLVFAEDSVRAQLRRRLVIRPRGRVLWVHPDSKVRGGLVMRSVNSLLVYRYDGHWQLADLTGRGQLRRKVRLRGQPVTPPTLDRLGRIVVTTYRNLQCFTPALKQVWQRYLYYPTSSVTPPPPGLSNRIYVGTKGGKLYALKSNSSEIWNTGASGPVHQPAVDANGDLYFCTGRNGKQLKRVLRAKSTRSATIAWQRTVGPCYGRPLITPGGRVIVSTDKGLVAFDRAGKRLWRRGFAGRGGPPVMGRRRLFVATTAGVIHAISTRGKHLWTFPIGRLSPPPLPRVGPRGNVYVAAPAGYVLAISPRGRLRWHVTVKNPTRHLAVRFDGAVAVVSQKHSIRLVAGPRAGHRRRPRP